VRSLAIRGDVPDETWVAPLKARRSSGLAGMVVGTRVRLADGRSRWALVGNVDVEDLRRTEHFLTLSLFVGGRWFTLARYHDLGVATRGPRALAAALGRPVDQVFPIAYDLRSCVRGDFPALTGGVNREPRERLSRPALIALAVP
jgi:hypothetical protein